MTWSTPPVKATGDFFTAAMWNTYVKDNPTHLFNITGASNPPAANRILVSNGTSETNVAWSLVPDAAMQFPHIHQDLLSAASLLAACGQTGFFQVNNAPDPPDSHTGENWYVMTIADPGGDTQFFIQITFSRSDETHVFFRLVFNGAVGTWRKLWHRGNDGSGSGLDADLLDGANTGNSAGNVPTNNGALQSTLNADMVDSAHAGTSNGNVALANGSQVTNLNSQFLNGLVTGNGSGNIPVNNGALNTNLNAQLLDSKSAGNANGNIPISNGTVNTNLNAELLGGSNLAAVIAAAVAAGTKIVTGSYSGNNSSPRQITTGFVCKFVFLYGTSGSGFPGRFGFLLSTTPGFNLIGTIASTTSNVTMQTGGFGTTALHATDGFVVDHTIDGTNNSATTNGYRYVAIG